MGSPVFEKLKNDELRFLDIIVHLDSTHVTALEQDFPSYISRKDNFSLVVNRTNALPPAKKLLSGTLDCCLYYILV